MHLPHQRVRQSGHLYKQGNEKREGNWSVAELSVSFVRLQSIYCGDTLSEQMVGVRENIFRESS